MSKENARANTAETTELNNITGTAPPAVTGMYLKVLLTRDTAKCAE